MGQIMEIGTQLHLVEAVKNNDEKVLKALYLECFYKIEAYILKNNGTKPQAKDTYQETFICAWQNVKNGKFTPTNESALQGYLYQIARNKWTDHLRSTHYKKTTQFSEGFQIADDSHLGQTDNPDSEKEQNVRLTMSAFNQLGTECKELLTHFYFGKKSLREIALDFNIGEASARNKKYRCINKLREIALSQK
jgi:RNA polymerase sigma factor (sigma-70 family)